MRIDILGVDGCIYCKKAKWLVTMPGADLECKYVTVSRDDKPSVEALIGSKYETYPVIMVDNKYIGGFDSLVDLLIRDDQGNITL